MIAHTQGYRTDDEKLSYIKDYKKKVIGHIEVMYEKLNSTMTKARELAEKNVESGTVIIATEQTEGKGRNGRTWISPIGGLWLSIILRPKINPNSTFILSYMASLSVAEAIKKFNICPKIKWPNDVLLDYKKVAGILIDIKSSDVKVEYTIIGIGINVNNEIPKLSSNAIEATSISEYVGKPIEISRVKRYLYDALERNYSLLNEDTRGYLYILKKWQEFDFLNGKTIKVYEDNSKATYKLGKVIGIDYATGGLIVEVNSKKMEIYDSATIRT